MKKTVVGITGANGRVGSVLVNGLVKDYDLRLFTWTPPQGNQFATNPLPSRLFMNTCSSQDTNQRGCFKEH